MTDTPTCETCRYFVVTDFNPCIGSCHRYPPTAYVTSGNTDGEMSIYTEWINPTVTVDEWCGEYKLNEMP